MTWLEVRIELMRGHVQGRRGRTKKSPLARARSIKEARFGQWSAVAAGGFAAGATDEWPQASGDLSGVTTFLTVEGPAEGDVTFSSLK